MVEVYLREQPRYNFTSTESEKTPTHTHIGITPPNIYRIPPEADHKSQATTAPTQPAHQKSTHNGCSTSPPKAEIARGTPSRKSTTGHLQQTCPKGVGLTCQRHPITPTILQKCFPKNPPRAGTTISATSHVPPADQQCTNRSHPTATINLRRNPSRHENGKAQAGISPLQSQKRLEKKEIRQSCSKIPTLFSRNSIRSIMPSDNQSNCKAVCLLIRNYI